MKKILLALALVLTAFTASAFTASIEPVEREASPDDQAVFNVSVFNNESEDRRFTLDYDFSRPPWLYMETSKVVPAGDTEDFRVTFNPSEDALEGRYSFNIFVTDFETGESRTLTDYIRVNRDYHLNIQEHSFSDRKVDPGSSVEASVTLQNILPRIVDNYSVSSSFMGESKDAQSDPLAPGSLKKYDFSYDVPRDASPSTENLSLTVRQGGQEQTFHQEVEINEIEDINISETLDDRVLTVSGTRQIKNNGNSPQQLNENISFPSYLDPVLTLNPEPDRVIEGDENTYVWEFTLEPGEEIELSYSINYWIPLVLALVIVAGLAVLGRLTGNMKVVKESEQEDEGLKVSLKIINDSEKYRPRITVRDFVPNVAELHEDFEMAEPEIRKTTDGTKIEWTLEDFKPGEERVIQYRITPKVEVEDGMELPDAEIIIDGDKVTKSR